MSKTKALEISNQAVSPVSVFAGSGVDTEDESCSSAFNGD